MDIIKSKVYILIDTANRIIRCEGGYTISQVDLASWILIDEGVSDRFNLCQAHYFDGGLYTTDGIPRYKYVDGKCNLRTNAEIEADRAAIPTPQPEKTLEEVAAYLNETARVVMELSIE